MKKNIFIYLRIRFGGREGSGLIPRSSGSETNMFAKQTQFNTPMTLLRGTLLVSGFLLFLVVINSCLDVEERTQETERQELNEYLNNLITYGHDVDTTDLGVYYVVVDPGEGPFPQPGDTLTIGYAGYFIDGSMFESTELSSETGDYTFIYKVDTLIPGLEDGLSLMNKGAKMEIIIPSELAYGAKGTMHIPKYTTLVFVTRMIDIKPVK